MLPLQGRYPGSSPGTSTINKTFIIYLFINNRRYSAIVIILFGGFYRVLKSPSSSGLGLVWLWRLVWDQEIGSSNLSVPTIKIII